MGDILGKLVKDKRKIEGRTTNDNKTTMINTMNKYAEGFGFEPLSKTASVKEVNHAKKIFDVRLAYDIVTQAIKEGNTVVASTYNVDLAKSDDKQDQRIAEYAPKIAHAKKLSDKKLTKEEKEQVDGKNQHIKGYGDEGIIKLVENVKTDKQMENLVKEISSQNPKQMYYDKKLETFEKAFRKIEGVREDDLNTLKEHLSNMEMDKLSEWHTVLLAQLERFYNDDKEYMGKFKDAEQELANARLNDIMIQMELKKGGIRKVNKAFDKYDTRMEEWQIEKHNRQKQNKNLGSKKRRNKERRKIKSKE